MSTIARRPVVFLDFDGVLNHDAHFATLPDGRTASDALIDDKSFDRACVQRVNAICDATGADVVVSSSWRQMYGLSDIRGILRRHGFTGRVVGKTPRLHRTPEGVARVRGHEIQSWIDAHLHPGPFVILDDVANMAHLLPRLVQTNMATGVNDADARRAIELLTP